MQTKIHLDATDKIHGTSHAIVIGSEFEDQLAIFFPSEKAEQSLRLISEVGEALDGIRTRIYADIRAERSVISG